MKAAQEIGAKLAVDHPLYGLIQSAYAVFRCDRPQDTGVCACCTAPQIMADFFRPEIADLPFSYLRDWYHGTFARPMPQALWAYMLPRVMEVVAFGEDPSFHGIELMFRAVTGDPALWTPAQWQVLDAFQRAMFRMQPPAVGWAIDDLLCAFSLGGWPQDALWAQVLDWPDATLVRRLHRDWGGGQQLVIWTTAFWNGDSTIYARYLDSAFYARIEDFALRCDDVVLAGQAIQVADAIQRATIGG